MLFLINTPILQYGVGSVLPVIRGEEVLTILYCLLGLCYYYLDLRI